MFYNNNKNRTDLRSEATHFGKKEKEEFCDCTGAGQTLDSFVVGVVDNKEEFCDCTRALVRLLTVSLLELLTLVRHRT